MRKFLIYGLIFTLSIYSIICLYYFFTSSDAATGQRMFFVGFGAICLAGVTIKLTEG